MASLQNTQMGSGPVSPAASSADLTKSVQLETTDGNGSRSLSPATSAGTPSGSKKTWTNAELDNLRLKIGLVAGALADFQAAGGLVAVKTIEYETPSGRLTATRLYLVAEGLNLVAVSTPDGLDFQLEAGGQE